MFDYDDITNTKEMTDFLYDIVMGNFLFDFVEEMIEKVKTYEDVGMLTYNDGLVITMKNGQKFHLTISEG